MLVIARPFSDRLLCGYRPAALLAEQQQGGQQAAADGLGDPHGGRQRLQPKLWQSLLPILLPMVLIAAGSVSAALQEPAVNAQAIYRRL